MARTVVGLFDSISDARDAVQDLIDAGIRRDDISLVANDARGEYSSSRVVGTDAAAGDFDTADSRGGSQGAEGATAGAVGGGVLGGALGLLAGIGALAIPGIGPVLAAGPLVAALGSAGAGAVAGAGLGAASGGLLGGLVGMGIPDEDANLYAEGVRRGGALVTVRTDDAMAERAADILQRHNIVDLDTRGGEWRKSGWSRFDVNAGAYNAGTTTTTTTTTAGTTRAASDLERGEAVLPVVEERIDIGKREVEGGTVRVHTKIEEKPVEEQVNLREERVRVERRPVDRPAGEADVNAFKEQEYRLTERTEEPVVRKEVRVIEEVVIGKDVRERTETVRDTVRRQDVHVHEEQGTGAVTGERTVSSTDYSTYDTDFRSHFTTNYGDQGYTYDQYSPVYRYGYSLATDNTYRGRDWADIESDARTRWEERNPGTWEQFKDSVRYAWDKARSKV